MAIQDLLDQLSKSNQQKSMTGNQAYGAKDSSLYQGYLGAEMSNREKQEQLALQKDQQAWSQNFATSQAAQSQRNFESQQDTAKSSATTSLVGQAVMGGTSLALQNKYLNIMQNGSDIIPMSESWSTGGVRNVQYGLEGTGFTPESADALFSGSGSGSTMGSWWQGISSLWS